MTHNLKEVSTARLEARLLDIGEYRQQPEWHIVQCRCDDFEVDEGYMIRDCDWNSEDAIAAELVRRDMKVAR